MADERLAEDPALSGVGIEERLDTKPSNDRDTAETLGNQIQNTTVDSSLRVQELVNHVLAFFSTASNETLGACIAGLGAATYFLLGRVGLVLIGIVGGIVLHATWEDDATQSDEQAKSAVEKARRKREDGFQVLQRVLDWREERQHAESEVNESINDIKMPMSIPKQLSFTEFEPSTGAALTGLTDAVIRDYMVRPADVFLDFLTNSSSIFIVFLDELANAFTPSTYSEAGAADSVNQYLEENPSSSLANLLDHDQQKKKLNTVSEDILQVFLDPKAYSCEPVGVFLRQVLGGLCIEMSVRSCSKPEWINGWIVYLLEQEEPGLMNAIDAGVGDATVAGTKERAASALNIRGKTANPVADLPMSDESNHKRTVSRAEEAMDEAMQEAKRLSEMIAAEEAKRDKGNEDTGSSPTTTGGGPTPTSSQSDLGALVNRSTSSLVGDNTLIQQPADPEPISSFTNFDQLLNSHAPTALQSGHTRTQSIVPPLTLHNASISIFDDALPGEKGTLRSKPTVDYLLQVEPATSQHPGWMIARKYADFETLHEVLRRISIVSGVPEFADRHAIVPGWKNGTKEALRKELERYLRDALSFNQLAESEGMKRFLEKDQGLGGSSPSTKQGGFGFPTPAAFESVGKGMLDVLSAAPKGAAGGGKAILGGVTGVLGGVGSLGQKRQIPIATNKPAQSPNVNLARSESNKSWTGDVPSKRMSQELVRTSFTASDRTSTLPLEYPSENVNGHIVRPPSQNPALLPPSQPLAANDAPNKITYNLQSPQSDKDNERGYHLPPPPSEIPDDWSTSVPLARKSTSTDEQPTSTTSSSSQPRPPRPKQPLNEKETRVAVELFFATITSLYTLSSAWSIRRTLLTAAKNFLLRPGNPNLEAIRVLIQDTMINSNVSDAGLASHIHKIRENALPTKAELERWPPPRNEGEKAKLRQKARKLLVEKGMPQALTSVMGQAASGEALGRVFDALQVEEVARGLMCALILQGVRAITQ
ncbi:MAG: hypothetical protein Q9170_001102 [Blastenia crenularia]